MFWEKETNNPSVYRPQKSAYNIEKLGTTNYF